MSMKSSLAGKCNRGARRRRDAVPRSSTHYVAERSLGAKNVLVIDVGGTWMMLTYGFGGMRDDDGTLSFWPRRAPEENAKLRFPLIYRGQLLEVEIGLDKVEYTLREGERLVIRHEMQEVVLTRDNPLAVRPVSRR